MNKFGFVENEIANRVANNQLRKLRPLCPASAAQVVLDGRTCLNFSSNDYLGLSKHPLLAERGCEYMRRFGTGSTASRLVCGTYDCVDKLEQKLARFKGSPRAMVLNSGFQANVSILPALADKQSLIISDQLNHASLIQGALLCRCAIARVGHNDTDHVRRVLVESQDKGYSRTLIVTESVFSMDGDRADLDSLSSLAEEFRAILVVDEAHSTGVLGEQGTGLCRGKNVDVVMGTFGKALGSFGAYVACSEMLYDYFVNRLSGFIYSTALPPAVIGAVDAALDLVPQMDEERKHLQTMADRVRRGLQAMGWSTLASSTQIIPVVIGPEDETMALSQFLLGEGILAVAIRPPTVEPGKSRIRLSLSASHTSQHVDRLLAAFEKWKIQGKEQV